MTVLLQLDRISRAFPGVQALSDITFSVEAGTVHALVGENGAGKSTLIEILSGALMADSGTLSFAGQPYRPRDPRQALRTGVATIHQELNLLPTRSVWENLMLGQTPARYGFIDQRRAKSDAYRVLQLLQAADLPLDVPVQELTLSQRQFVAIGRALSGQCRLLILDEPTAALNEAEAAALFNRLMVLRQQGVTLLYVSHRLDEIFRIAQTVTVLRDGRHVQTTPLHGTAPADLIAAMLGRPLSGAFPQRVEPRNEVVLTVDHLGSGRVFEDVSFQLRAGEVLAITGLAGSGKAELGQALFGVWPIERGQVRWFDQELRLIPPRAVAAGVGYLPEDRKQESLLLDTAVQRNITLAVLRRLARRGGMLDRPGEQRLAQQQVQALHIKVPALTAPVRVLSGGNQQKTALAKWLAAGVRVLILQEPTQGIDVGVKFEVYDLIAQLARSGAAILLISAELPEVVGLAHRMLVMRAGKIVAEFSGEQASITTILRAAAGV